MAFDILFGDAVVKDPVVVVGIAVVHKPGTPVNVMPPAFRLKGKDQVEIEETASWNEVVVAFVHAETEIEPDIMAIHRETDARMVT